MTQKCNLNCSYCGSSVDPDIMPINLDYSLLDLQAFLSKLEKQPIIAFYGGEPTINWKKIVEIVRYTPAEAFMLQTNGTLLHKLPEDIVKKFNSILISVDGRPDTTDLKRGEGIHQRAIRGAKFLRDHGFNRDLVARMTVTQYSDIFKDVKYLIEHQDPYFNHVHWQLDVLWDTYYEEIKEDIQTWLLDKYNPGISKLVNFWMEVIEKHHRIPGIAPFMGIMYTLLSEKPVGLRCGAGKDFFSITTDGRVTICPILPSVSFATVGNIFENTPQEMQNMIELEDPCISCEVRPVCGGRCIYTNKTKYWGKEGFDLVCQTVKHLIHELESIKPRIQELLRQNIFSIEDFRYPKVPNGVEIIP